MIELDVNRGDAMYEYEVALATPKYIFYLNKLVHLIISYPTKCDFATTNYFTCHLSKKIIILLVKN